jgi:hypothetical protein
MEEIKTIGSMQLLDDIEAGEFIPTGVEGDVAPLLFGETMSSQVMRYPPGFYPAHAHTMELLIYCQKGECDVFQGQGEVRGRLRPGGLLYVPPGGEIGMAVDEGTEPCQMVVFIAPRKKTREEFLQGLEKWRVDK